MRRTLVLIGLFVLLPSTVAGCSFDSPNITGISPAREATDVPTNQEVSITFDRAMNRTSVERRFELRPALGGCRTACKLVWRGNTLVYTHPGVTFQLSTRYEVILHAGYADSGGTTNGLDHSWFFSTEGRPVLTAVSPSDHATGVPVDTNLVLSFNRPMDADSIQAGVQLEPTTPFTLRARPGGDGSQFEVIPLSVLSGSQSYTLSLENAMDTHGNMLLGRQLIRFTTGAASYPRRVAYLVGESDSGAFGIAVVDPRPDPLLNRPVPKIVYQLSFNDRQTMRILGFDWAPDARRMVVLVGPNGGPGTLRIVDLLSGTVQDLGLQGTAVTWSPDGTVIAYLHQGDLHGYRLSTATDSTLIAGGHVIAPLAFSPDGTSLAYAALDALGTPRLQIYNLALHSSYRPIGLDDPADRPAWSFDGTKLAFRRMTAQGPELWVYDLSASGSSAYRKETALDVISDAWLNDNSSLVATVGQGPGASLYRINIFAPTEAGGVVRLTGSTTAPSGTDPSTPVYDRRIAFTGSANGLSEIFLMNGDGSGAIQLSEWQPDFPYTGTAANWSPSG
jgi:Tol biopolymer transport system component